MDSNNVMVKFIGKLDDYVRYLNQKVVDVETIYNAHSYLMNTYKQNLSIVEQFSSIPLDKIYELLLIFDNSSLYSKQDIENALKFCKMCEMNPKFKEHERYKEMYGILEYVNSVFNRHIFSNQAEANVNRVKSAKDMAKRFGDLKLFIDGKLPSYVLEPLESYYFETANLSEEEWLEVYYNLTMIQIEYYKKEEDTLREEISVREEKRRKAIADALEKKIMDSLPKEDAMVLNPNGDNEEVSEVEEEVEEPTLSSKSLSSNEEISQKLALLHEKYKTYRALGKITPTMRDSFKLNLDLSDIDKSIEYVKVAYNTTDYYKFLFFCFYEKYSTILSDVNESYDEDYDEYVQFILADIDMALDFISRLESEMALESKELEEVSESDLPLEEEDKKQYTLIFYDNGSSSEMEKCLKSMTPEKVSDLTALLSRLEEGRFDNVKMMKKKVKVGFKLMTGQYVFVTFRTLPNNHILVYTSGSLEEMNNNRVDNRLGAYDIGVEKKINSIIKDGTLEYRKLIKRSEEIRNIIFSQGLGKGVQ